MLAARQSLAHARKLISNAIARDPADPRLLALRGRYELVAASEVFVAPDSGRLAQALSELRAAQKFFTAFLRTSPDDINEQLDLWQSQVMSGRVYSYLGETSRIRAFVEPTLVNGSMRVRTAAQRARRDFILNGAFLMLAEASDSDPPVALRFYNRLVRSVARLQSRSESNVADDYIQSTGLAGRAQMEARMHAYGDASRDYRQSLTVMDKLLSAGPNSDIEANRALVQYRAAATYGHLGEFVEARNLLSLAHRWAVQPNVASKSNAMRLLALLLAERGQIEAKAGNNAASCAAYRKAAHKWAILRATGTSMTIDTIKGGPVDQASAAAAHCQGKRSDILNHLSPGAAGAKLARLASGA